MWYWLRRNTHERSTLVTILIISAMMHAGFLAWFFFGFKDRSSQLACMVTPEMLNNEIEFVFGPVRNTGVKAGVKGAPAKKNQKKEKSVPEKKLDMKTSVAQKPAVKPAQKKIQQKKAAAKPIEKKEEPAKVPEPIVKEPEKAEQPAAKPSEPIALSTHEGGAIQQQIGIHERGLIDEYVALQKEIVAQWAPPPGIAHDCSCLVSIMVDWEGIVKDIMIEKSSGVLVYDASARAALAKLAMPRWTWGKTITITFNQ